jgi:hypothetical protein
MLFFDPLTVNAPKPENVAAERSDLGAVVNLASGGGRV